MLLLQQMFILFIIMLVGFVCKKKGIITNAGSKVISSVVVNVANPALILTAGINKEERVTGGRLLLAVGLAAGVYAFLILAAFFLPKLLRVSKQNVGTYHVMTVFSNIGFMGFPVISAVYGSEALLYASVFLIPYNVLIYTWGILAMSKRSEAAEQEERHGTKGRIQWKKIFNIGVIACILTILLYLTGLHIPEPVETVIKNLSNLTAPLSMMIIGASMTEMQVKELISDIRLLLFMVIKLLLLPVIGVLIVKGAGIEPKLVGVCLIMLATPVGSMTAMLAQEYDGDYALASKGVALSTVLSVATMPLLSILLQV